MIASSEISTSPNREVAAAEARRIDAVIKDKEILEIDDFAKFLNRACQKEISELSGISGWLNTMFGLPK